MSYSYKNILCRGMITLECVDEIAFYKAELMSSNGNIFRQGDKDTEITFIVFKGAEDITDNFSDIEWKRFTPKSNGIEDKAWSEQHNGKRAIILTKEEIEGKCIIQCSAYSTIQGVRTLMAAASITFIDVNDFTPSKEPPLNPMDGDIWIDSSVDPPVIKIWDDEKKIWVEIEAAGSSTRNLINNSSFWKSYSIEDDFIFENKDLTYEHRVVPELNKRWAEIKTVQWDEVPRGIYQDINKSLYLGETYLFQVKAYTMNEADGFYDGGITLEIVDVDNSLEEEVEISLKKETFKLRREIDTYYILVNIPKKITKIRAKVYGENGSIFWIRFTELSLSHSSKLHEWELSQEDLEWKIDNKLSNDRESVFNALTDNGAMQGIYVATDEITGKPDYYINAEYIKSGKVTAEHIDAKGLEVIKEDKTKTLEITPDGDIHIIANEFTLVPSAKTNVATEEQLDGKADATTEGIVNALNDTGIFLQEGKLVINADNIATGVLRSKDDKTVFDLDKGTFRVGESDEIFKMKYDGTDLLFGKGSIKWENLDDKIAENLSPYDVYLEKTDAIVPDNINDTQVEFTPEGEVLHVPDNKPINRIMVMKGNTELKGIEENPKDGEFSFTIISQEGCEAFKLSPESFYINKMNQDVAKIKVEINCENKKNYIKTMGLTILKIDGVHGPKGEPGLSAAIIYTKSLEEPPIPEGNNPEGWFERIEEIIETGHLWCSQGLINSETKQLEGQWSKPIKLEEMNNNLLQNYPFIEGTGAQSIYGISGQESENKRIKVTDHKGDKTVAWVASNQDNRTDGGYDGGFIASVKVNSYNTYRYSFFIKQIDETNPIEIAPSALTTADFISGQQNYIPSMFDGKMPEPNKWYLAVGYIAGEGESSVPENSGIYDVETGKRVEINGKLEFKKYRILSGGETQQMIARTYSIEKIGAETYFTYPRIDLVDGNEISVDGLLGLIEGMDWINEWNGTKTEINGSSVLSPKLFIGQLESNKSPTGIAIGSNVINNTDSGITGYSIGEKTFHIKTDGSAIFGKETGDHIEIGTDGTLTLPKIKGENIEAKNLVVTHTNPDGTTIDTLSISDSGEITIRASKFELLGQPSEGDSSLETQLQQLGFLFEGNKFVINASQITTGQLSADKLNLKGLTIKNNKNETTLEINHEGNVTLKPISFNVTVKNETDANGNSVDNTIDINQALTPDNIANIINNASVKIKAKHINLNGYVTFTNIDGNDTYEDDNGNKQIVTVIDGGTVKTGTLFVDRLRPLHYWNKSISFFNEIYSQAVDMKVDASLELTKGGLYDKAPGFRFKLNDQNYVGIFYNEDYTIDRGEIKFFTSPKKNSKGSANRLTICDSYILSLVDILPIKGKSISLGNTTNHYSESWINKMRAGSAIKIWDEKGNITSISDEKTINEFDYFKNYRKNYEDEAVLKKDNLQINTYKNNQNSDLINVTEDKEVFINISELSCKQSLCLEVVTNKIESLEATCAYLNQERNTLRKEIDELKTKLKPTEQTPTV